MKRLILLAAFGLATATALPVVAGTIPATTATKEDTIQIKLANGAVMTLALKNSAQLKSFRTYSLDSLMRMLDTYIVEAEKMEKKSGTTKEYTVTFNPAKETNNQRNPEKINITIKNEPQTAAGGVVKKGIFVGVDYDENGEKKTVKINTDPNLNCAPSDSTKISAKKSRRNDKGLNIDLGFNTLLNTKNNQLDVAGLKPWGSRYVSLNPYYQFRIGPKTSPFHLRTGLEFSFNNYMFDRNYVLIDSEASGTNYTILKKDERNLEKSKLATTTVNLPLMGIVDFKDSKNKSQFRIGAGGFVGYRLGSHTKIKYNQNGNDKKDKDPGNFNLQDFQYGAKFTIGFRGIDLFANYNLNELFKNNHGPKANTLSFGITL